MFEALLINFRRTFSEYKNKFQRRSGHYSKGNAVKDHDRPGQAEVVVRIPSHRELVIRSCPDLLLTP